MRTFATLLLCVGAAQGAEAGARARNVILFLGDAGGISTLNAASIHGYGKARALYIQSMPHIGLSDTSTASEWVSDSAAGMTAIVTGEKTHNGVLSQSSSAVRRKKDGAFLKTILEYAEERGLSTGIVTNRPVHDATPAACFAHVNYRKNTAEILSQFLNPRFGDGVDLLIGAGRREALAATAAIGLDWPAELAARGYDVGSSLEASAIGPRNVVLLESGKFALEPVLLKTIEVLSRNPNGYFLMVEWDMHTDKLPAGLDNAVEMDRAIRRAADEAGTEDTLILYSADHSFDLRLQAGKKGDPLLAAPEAGGNGSEEKTKAPLSVMGSHTGEEVLVAARGPGAERVRGYMANTDLFRVMLAAYGWPISRE